MARPLDTHEALSGLNAKTVSRLTPEGFRARIKESGWRLVELAYRWGITENYLTRLIADPDRAAHWDDAVRGLPQVKASDLRQFKKYRIGNPPAKVPTRARKTKAAPSTASGTAIESYKTGPDYAYVGFLDVGDVLTVVEDMSGHEIYAGDEGVIVRIDEDDHGMHYRIDFNGTLIWLRSQDISHYLVETGKSRPVPIGQKGDSHD